MVRKSKKLKNYFHSSKTKLIIIFIFVLLFGGTVALNSNNEYLSNQKRKGYKTSVPRYNVKLYRGITRTEYNEDDSMTSDSFVVKIDTEYPSYSNSELTIDSIDINDVTFNGDPNSSVGAKKIELVKTNDKNCNSYDQTSSSGVCFEIRLKNFYNNSNETQTISKIQFNKLIVATSNSSHDEVTNNVVLDLNDESLSIKKREFKYLNLVFNDVSQSTGELNGVELGLSSNKNSNDVIKDPKIIITNEKNVNVTQEIAANQIDSNVNNIELDMSIITTKYGSDFSDLDIFVQANINGVDYQSNTLTLYFSNGEGKWQKGEFVSFSKEENLLNFNAQYSLAAENQTDPITLYLYKGGIKYKEINMSQSEDPENFHSFYAYDYNITLTYGTYYAYVADIDGVKSNVIQFDIKPGGYIDEPSHSLNVGKKIKLAASIEKDEDNETSYNGEFTKNSGFSYEIKSGKEFISLDSDGTVTALKEGTATILITKTKEIYKGKPAYSKEITITVYDKSIKILNKEIKQDVYEIHGGDKVYIDLFIPYRENIQKIDASKVELSADGFADIGVMDKKITDSTTSSESNYTLTLEMFYNWTKSDQTLSTLKIPKGTITYKDGSTNEELVYNDISINIKKIIGTKSDNKILENKTYTSVVTPISLAGDLDFRGSYNVSLTKDGQKVEGYEELGQPIKESGSYSLKLNCSDYNEYSDYNFITYDFTIDIAEIVMQDIKVETNELTGSFDIKLTLNNIDNLKNFNVNNIKFYDSENNIVKLNSSIIGKTVDHDEDYNYLITYKELDTNNKNVDIAKIVLKEGTISYYNKDKKEYSENKEYSHNVSIKINQLIDNLTETNPVPFKPNISVINEDNQDDYLVLLYKNNKLIKNYQYGDAIEEEGTYTLKIIYNDSIYKITFNVVNTKYIELNEETDDIKIDEENKIISLYTPNDISSFKNRFKTLKAKIYNSNSKLENSKITGTELTDEKNITTGSKVVLNKNTILEDDIYTVVVKGDINKDGLVDMADIYLMGRLIAEYDMDLNDYQIMAASISKNNKTNMADLTLLCQYVAEMRDTFKGVIK